MRYRVAVPIGDEVFVIDGEEVGAGATFEFPADRPVLISVGRCLPRTHYLEAAFGIGRRQAGPPHEIADGGRPVAREVTAHERAECFVAAGAVPANAQSESPASALIPAALSE